jgi:hypothetical protein
MNPGDKNPNDRSALAQNSAKRMRELGYYAPDASGPIGELSGANGVAGALAPVNSFDANSSFSAGLGRWLDNSGRTMANNAGRNLWSHGAVPGAALTGGAAAALGYGGARLWNLLAGQERQLAPGHVAAITGLLGAAGGGYLGNNYQKSASAHFAQSPAAIREAAIDAIAADRSLSSFQQSAAASALQNMGSSDLQQLLRSLSTVGGAALGAAIFRFLMGKGLIPMLVGAGVGALAGSHFGGSSTNALGQKTFGPGGFFG